LGGSEVVGRLRLGRAGHPMYPPSLVVLLRSIHRMSTDTCYLVNSDRVLGARYGKSGRSWQRPSGPGSRCL
jgi:hypothetical protein